MKILCVIDVQEDFIRGPLSNDETKAVLVKIADKINNTSDDDYIIYTRDTHTASYLNSFEGKHLPIPHCLENSAGWQVCPEATAVFDNLGLTPAFIDKPTFGSFDLLERLNQIMVIEEGDITIEFIGVCTDICVVSNVLMTRAAFPDINIVVDASCCAGTSPEAHQAALKTMASCQIEIINN